MKFFEGNTDGNKLNSTTLDKHQEASEGWQLFFFYTLYFQNQVLVSHCIFYLFGHISQSNFSEFLDIMFVCRSGVFFAVWGLFFLSQSSATVCEAVCYISMPNTGTSLLQGELRSGGAMQRETQTCITTIRNSTLIKKGFRLDSTLVLYFCCKTTVSIMPCSSSKHAPLGVNL